MAVHVGRLLFFLLVAVVFQCVQVQIASAVACTFVPGSTCKCNLATGGQIDLSPLFAGGQLSVRGAPPDTGFTFTYDACTPVPCNNKCNQGGGCLVCEDGGGANVFGIGSVNSASISDVSTSDWTFVMSYSNAQENTMSRVTYKLDVSGGTHFTFTSESPKDTYNMAVSGCFNTPISTCPSTKAIPCKADSGNPCMCALADGSGTIDMSPMFKEPLVTKAYGSTFLYHACKTLSCGPQCINCSGCQLSSTGDVWGLGTLASTNITATYMPDGGWALTVFYSNPAQGRRFTVFYTLESPGSEPVFQFVTEITPSNIVFSIHGCFNNPKKSCATPQHTI